MKYQVRFVEGKVVSCVPDGLRADGEIYYSVFDGSANVTVEEKDAVTAIERAKAIYKRSLQIE